MSAINNSRRRQIVPRWRTWKTTSLLGEEFDSSDTARLIGTATLEEKIAEFRENPELGIASDLFSVAIVNDQVTPEVVAIATDVMDHDNKWPLLAELATRIAHVGRDLEEPSSLGGEQTNEISAIKRILEEEPRNSVRWVDLSREYLILGETEKANRSMRIALQLAPENRFVLRATATLHWAQDDLFQAISVLRSNDVYRRDPRVFASLIALSDLADVKLVGMRDAVRLIGNRNFKRAHTAELAAAIGSMEFASGADKKGRRLLIESLETPTENVLAQAIWLQNEKKINVSEDLPKQMLDAYEARSRQFAQELEWSKAAASTQAWVQDQSFSTQAAKFGSFSACEARDWALAINFAKNGLRSSPHDAGLMNNLAYAQIQSGDLSGAIETLVAARAESAEGFVRSILEATEGLLLFRAGHYEASRSKYANAIRDLVGQEQWELALDAAIMIALEEIAENTPLVDQSKNRIEQLQKRVRGGRVLEHLNWMSEDETYLALRIASTRVSNSVTQLAVESFT